MKFLKIYWISCVSFLFTISIFPCVDEPFHPEYFFLEELLTFQKQSRRDPIYISEIYREINIQEWNKFLGKTVSKEETEKLLYNTETFEIERILKNPTEFKKLGNKKQDFFTYLLFAKKNENYSFNPNLGQWEEKESSKNLVKENSDLIQEGLKLLETTKNSFLKERYIFQIVRLYYFLGNYNESINFYNTNNKDMNPKGTMKARSLGYVAGSHFQLKQFGEANAIYSKLFYNNPLQKEVARTSFHPFEEEDWNQTLSLLNNSEERIAAWFLFGMKFDRATGIQEIFKIDSNSKYINLLLARAFREVNSIVFENEPDISNLSQKELKKIEYLKDPFLLKVVNEIVLKKEKDFTWKIAASHLHYLSGDFSKGDQFLREAESLKKKNKLHEKQFHLTSLLGKMLKLNELNEEKEKEVLPHLNFIFSSDAEIQRDERMDYPAMWVRKVLAFYLAKKGEELGAQWIFPSQNPKFYASLEKINQMISFLENKSRRPFLLSFQKSPFYSYEDLLLLQGIRLTYQEKLKEALAVFEKIPDSFFTNLTLVFQNDPFQGNINDYYNLNYDNKPNQVYHYKSFLRELIELQASSDKSPDVFYKLGNAYYNISYFGNSGFSANNVYGIKTYAGWGYFPTDSKKEDFPELDTSIALKYYLKAKEISSEPEFRAKLTFMAAKTEQAEFVLKPESEKQGKDFQAGKYFQELKDNFKDTQYYSEILKECTYFLKFNNR